MELPEWYDEILFKRAQDFFSKNMFAMMAGKLCGLLAVLAVPSILKILICTKASSCPFTAYKRYLETIFHTLCWYEDELKPGSRSWKSLEAVRKGHIVSSKHTEKKEAGFISQRDMALTQFGFMGYIVLKPDKLGVQVSNKDLEAFIHFWRVIGHLIGIQDKYNLCTGSYRTTKIRLEHVLDEIYRPLLEETGNDFIVMAKALIEGLWCFNPLLDCYAIVYFTKWMSDCKNYVYHESDPRAADFDLNDSRRIIQSLNWYSRLILYIEVTAHTYLVNFFVFRWYFNNQVWISQYIIYWFPFLAFYKFGIKKSYIRILKGMKEGKGN
ncbi:uncharacterized protein LOC129576927 isoform X2 [Sitodiplosis mosellana]|nr:uncharacterized protein LOC129576927 isoform X2 [Sitodiplosis mosellana]